MFSLSPLFSFISVLFLFYSILFYAILSQVLFLVLEVPGVGELMSASFVSSASSNDLIPPHNWYAGRGGERSGDEEKRGEAEMRGAEEKTCWRGESNLCGVGG